VQDARAFIFHGDSDILWGHSQLHHSFAGIQHNVHLRFIGSNRRPPDQGRVNPDLPQNPLDSDGGLSCVNEIPPVNFKALTEEGLAWHPAGLPRVRCPRADRAGGVSHTIRTWADSSTA